MNSIIKNVLVATDFSDCGNNAVRVAVSICKKLNATLHLYHVMENRYIIDKTEIAGNVSEVARQIDAISREKLYNIYQSISGSDNLCVQLHMPKGIPFDEICKTSVAMPIDLVILGTQGITGKKTLSIGSTAHNVIKNITIPVLTVPPGFDQDGFLNILFPVRPENGIKRKFEFLNGLITNIKDVHIHLAAIYHKGMEEEMLSYKMIFHEMVTYMKQEDISFTKDLYKTVNTAELVLSLAEKNETDLIVINSTLDHHDGHFYAGYCTLEILDRSKVPVLSYREAIDVVYEAQKQKTEDPFHTTNYATIF